MSPKELADLATELNTRRYSRKGETEMICSRAAEAIRTILANGYAPEGMVLVPEAWQPTHKHWKGGLYRAWTDATVEADMSTVVVYQGADGRYWTRPQKEFHERFVLWPVAAHKEKP